MSENAKSMTLAELRAAKRALEHRIAQAVSQELSAFVKATGVCPQSMDAELLVHYSGAPGAYAADMVVVSNVKVDLGAI